MTDWWSSDPIAPASDPSFTGYIPGQPKPKDITTWSTLTKDQAAASGLDPSFTWQRSSAGETKKVGDAGDPQKDELGDAIKGLGIDELVSNVKKARSAIDGGYATGVTGAVLSRVPGTSAADFRGYVDAIQGGIILEKLQSLKEASKTGASGLGALSEKEGERLAAAVAAIKPNMSDKALKESLDAIEQHANFLRAVQEGKDPRDPNVAKTYGLGVVPASPAPASGGGDGPPGGGGSGGPPAVREVEQKGFGLTQPDEVPGAREYRAGLYSAMRSKKIKSYEDTVAFTDAFNQQHGTNLPPPMKDKGLSNAIAAAQQGKAFDIALPQHDARTLKLIEDMRKNDGAGTAFKHGARDAITLGAADEIRGGVEGFAGALRGEGSFSDIYAANRDAERYNDNALMTDHPRAYVGGQLVGGVALAPLAPIGEAGTLGALARTGAKSGAAYGALYGFNSGTDAESRLSGAGMGAATGATVGALSPYVATAAGKAVSPLIPRRFKAPLGMDPELAAASEAEGVDLIRPMVDPKAISDYGALESNVYSQPIIRGAAGRVRGQIEDRASALGADGTPLNTEAAGSLIQGAARRFIERSKTVANQLYNRARNLAGDATVTPRAALGQLRQELMALKETPNVNQGETEFLNELGDDLTKGPLSIDAIRGLRSSVRGRINQSGLTATQADARASRVLDALQQDVTAALPEGAATAYKRADAFYRERMVHIDDIIGRFLGKRDNPISGEQAFNRLKSMTSPGGDGRRLGGLMRGLTGDERQDIAATIAQSLGRRGADEPFSTALFISQTRKLSPSARRTIFGPDGAQSIDNLRLLSRKLEEAEKDINRSRSATVLERQGIRTAARAFISGLAGVGGTAVTGSISGGVAGVAAAGGAMGVSAARRVLSARAMVNPRVSRWMAEAADVSTPQQAKEATRKLSIIISREPALAHELQPVYDFLENRLELPLAANPDQGSEGNNE